MTWTFDERLHVLGPCTLYKFAHGVEFGKLGRIVGIVGGAGTQSVAERYCHVILCTDVADVVEMVVEEALLLMHHAPF